MRRLLFALALVGCGAPVAPRQDAPVLAQPSFLVGPLTREQVLGSAKWREAFEAAEPDPAAARALGNVPKGARVDVYFGTWCPDSRYEVSRLFKSLDAIGSPPPFAVRLIGVDRQKHAPAEVGLVRVPTFVVYSGETEIGRIVEHAPEGIETELTALLSKPR